MVWPIEIDGLPIKNGDFPWQTVSHNQRVWMVFPFQWPFVDFPAVMASWDVLLLSSSRVMFCFLDAEK
jgi:hypothetical protein